MSTLLQRRRSVLRFAHDVLLAVQDARDLQLVRATGPILARPSSCYEMSLQLLCGLPQWQQFPDLLMAYMCLTKDAAVLDACLLRADLHETAAALWAGVDIGKQLVAAKLALMPNGLESISGQAGGKVRVSQRVMTRSHATALIALWTHASCCYAALQVNFVSQR
jgi:hypothetical protein